MCGPWLRARARRHCEGSMEQRTSRRVSGRGGCKRHASASNNPGSAGAGFLFMEFPGWRDRAFSTRPRRTTRRGLTGRQGPAHTAPVAANSATGFDSPSHKAHMRPSPDAGAFSLPTSPDGRSQPGSWRAVRGSRKARRSLCRSVNRVPSATPFDSGLADSSTQGVCT